MEAVARTGGEGRDMSRGVTEDWCCQDSIRMAL